MVVPELLKLCHFAMHSPSSKLLHPLDQSTQSLSSPAETLCRAIPTRSQRS